MIHIEEKIYFYLLLLIPFFAVAYLGLQFWKARASKAFAQRISLSKLGLSSSYLFLFLL